MLLKDLDAIIDLSRSETIQIIQAFKRHIEHHFQVDKDVLNKVFEIPAGMVLNQQEDEDDMHTLLGEQIYSYAF